MSTTTTRRATARSTTPKRRRQESPEPVELRVVDRASWRWQALRRFLFLAVLTAVGAVLLAVAAVHAWLVQNQQELDQVRYEVRELRSERADLEQQVVVAGSPQVIIDRATGLGMVRAVDPVYLEAVPDPVLPADTDPAGTPTDGTEDAP